MEGGKESGFLASMPDVRIKLTTSRNIGGKRKTKEIKQRGRHVKSRPLDETATSLAVAATLRKAAFRIFQDEQFSVTRDDLMAKVYAGKGGASILFVVDASGSMGVEELMAKTKSMVVGLLKDAYQKRERVGMIVFRGTRADLTLPFTRSVEMAKSRLKDVQTGGKTPLSLAVKKALDEIGNERQKNRKNQIVLLFFTDGRANIALGDGDPFDEAVELARKLKKMKDLKSFVVDTDPTWISYPYAKDLAKELNAKYFKLTDVFEKNIRELIYR